MELPEDAGEVGVEEAVRVCVRIRPLNKRELAEKQTIGWNFNETAMLEDTPNGQRVYAYDHCFGPSASNQETYDIVGKPVVLKAMDGYNGTVFTYGQTGSGKTWTMRGCESDPGMMVLCIRDILDWVRSHSDMQFKIKVSYLEVYNEEINDLLGEQGPASKNLKIVSEDAVRGAVIGGLVEEPATTAEDFMAILQRGEASRSYASTNMNAESSRSHTIYRVSIEARDKSSLSEEDADKPDAFSSGARVSYLNLVDLAGSERQKSTKAEGKVLKEGANINKSLLALAAVINKLGEASKKVKGAKPAFIPYRDSKLTRILKQSLGGNTLTSILCAVTPAPMHREETVSTLKFGQTCKSIKNNVKSNDGVLDDKAMIKQLRATIAEMRGQLDEVTTGDFSSRKGTDEAIEREKSDLERRVQVLKTMLVSQGTSPADIANALQTLATNPDDDASGAGDGSGGGGSALASEVAKLTDKLAEQSKVIVKLQRKLGEYRDLEESKASLEEYEHHIRQELDEVRNKLDEEKHTLQMERHKLLKDRGAIDEKENRVGILITNLDEKESKLRQLMATMREQQEQWQRSVTDLQRREDLVDDWQRNHKQREKKLMEIEAIQEKKFQELNRREAAVLEEESRAKQLNKELSEREQRLQVSLSRISNMEVANAQKEEGLAATENALKKRMNDCDIRERELASRRKEMESWDVLLREKDRKILSEQRDVDDREAAMQVLEEKNKSHEIENERKRMELKGEEQSLRETIEKYDKLSAELDEKERDLKERDREYHALRKDLSQREEELKRWEKQLLKLQEQMRGIEARDKALRGAEEAFKAKEDEFYNVKVAQITARHSHELRAFEEVVQRQLKIVADFQREIETMRAEAALRSQETAELEAAHEQRGLLIEQLREQLLRLEANPAAALLQDAEATRLFPASPAPSEGLGTAPSPPPLKGDAPDGSASAPAPAASLERRTSFTSAHMATARLQAMQMHAAAAGPAVHQPDFLTQLAITRNMIHQVLEKFDAVPDGKGSPSARRLRHRMQSERKGDEAVSDLASVSVSPPPPPPPPPAMLQEAKARPRRQNITSPEVLAGLGILPPAESPPQHPQHLGQHPGQYPVPHQGQYAAPHHGQMPLRQPALGMAGPGPVAGAARKGEFGSGAHAPAATARPFFGEDKGSPLPPQGSSPFGPRVALSLGARVMSAPNLSPQMRKSAIKGSTSPAVAGGKSPVPQKSAPAAAAAAAKKASPGVFGQEFAGIVSSGEVDEFGIPITVVNLNKRSGIKKFAESIH